MDDDEGVRLFENSTVLDDPTGVMRRQGIVALLGVCALGITGFVGAFVSDIRPVQVSGYPSMAVVEYNLFPDKIRIDSDGNGSYDMTAPAYVNKNFPGETRERMKDITDSIYGSQ